MIFKDHKNKNQLIPNCRYICSASSNQYLVFIGSDGSLYIYEDINHELRLISDRMRIKLHKIEYTTLYIYKNILLVSNYESTHIIDLDKRKLINILYIENYLDLTFNGHLLLTRTIIIDLSGNQTYKYTTYDFNQKEEDLRIDYYQRPETLFDSCLIL